MASPASSVSPSYSYSPSCPPTAMIHLEPSIKTEFSESALRFEPRTEHVSTLFSPPTSNYHLLEVSNGPLRLPSPMQHQQPPSPSHRSTNPMSVSSLCSPASSMPPHFAARGPTTSPSSRTSSLSSPPNSPHSPSAIRPASPRIEVLATPAPESASRQFLNESSSSRPQPPARSHSQMRQQSTPLALVGDDHAGQEYDERTKTWKNATGFRRDLTADKLTQPDAPTRRKRPATTVRRGSAAVSTAASATPGPAPVRARHAVPPVSSASHHSGSGESFAEDDDDELASELLGEDRIASFAPTHQPTPSGKKRKISERASSSTVDPGTPAPGGAAGDVLDDEARLEKKRRQNTQAARRSRIRKAEEVQKLQTRVATLEAELEARNTRLTAARRDAASAHALHRAEVEFGGVLKNTIVDLVGEARGAEAIARAKQRWRAMCPPPRSSDEGSDSNEKEKENYGHGAAQAMDLDYDADYDSKTGARGGS